MNARVRYRVLVRVVVLAIMLAMSGCTLLGVTIGGLSASAANADIDDERAQWQLRRARMITTDEDLARCKEARIAIFQRAGATTDLEERARVLGTLPQCVRETPTEPPPQRVSVGRRAGIGALVGLALDVSLIILVARACSNNPCFGSG